jgi:hypothetical protein
MAGENETQPDCGCGRFALTLAFTCAFPFS